jgi:asparagine synthase (glutamine-hydrolysing)
MCGIAGVIDGAGEPVGESVARQVQLLSHRGHDASGVFGGSDAMIAQNRLAVVDLHTGDPPMTNEDRTVGAVLNGEIYNFQQLRGTLAERGHRLRSRGDTEVLAHLAEELDAVELARSVDGMFAFAVWDERRRRLMLGRDRVGKKPLYYYYHSPSDTLVFASEIKGVLAHPRVPRELNERALPAYLTFGYVPTPETFFAGVVSLPPGHVLTFEPGSAPVLESYWEMPLRSATSARGMSRADAASAVRDSLARAVSRRLVADVPVGAFLSGGIDSSAIVALVAVQSTLPVRTFTIGFEDADGFDERPYARLVAERYATDHTEFVVRPDALELVETLLWHCDQPFGDSSAIPTYLLNELTRGDVTVALSGDGADELFAGYERFTAAVALARYQRLPQHLRSLARRGLACAPAAGVRSRLTSARRFVAAADRPLPEAYRSWLSLIDEEDRDRALPGADRWALEHYESVWRSTDGGEPLDRLLALNARTYLLDDLLVKADRMSMAHALEVRSPFLDAELLALAFSLPPELKLRGLRRKCVLVDAIADLVPRPILRRRKRGFGVPLDRWFREDLRHYLETTVGASDARLRSYLGADFIGATIDEHMSGRRHNGQLLWALTMLELFLRREGW